MEDIDFEEQLKQEELQKLKEEEGEKGTGNYRDKDGIEYEWDDDKKAWFPKITEDFIAQYQMSYGSNPMESNSENDKTETKTDKNTEGGERVEEELDENKVGSAAWLKNMESLDVNSEEYLKRYNEYYSYYYGEDYANYYNYYNQEEVQGEVQLEGKGQEEGQKGKKRKKKGEKGAPPPKKEEGWFEVEEDKNTNVYVSGLPSDITHEEFKELMNKCGLVMFDPLTKQPKLKLYLDEHGNPKGDGRCCYIKVESVNLALNILDGSELRGKKIHVERAQFTMKGQFDPSKKKKKLTNKQKRKFQEKQQKLFDWRPEKKIDPSSRPKNERVVVLKNMFDPKEFEDDPMLINELRDDTRNECAKLGEVRNIRLFDNHPDGVITITMKTPEEADAVIKLLNGRWFAKKKVLAETWDGRTKYEIEESEAERDKRMKKWENYLETGEKKDSNNKNNETSGNDKPQNTNSESTENLDSKSSEKGESVSSPSSESSQQTSNEQTDSSIEMTEGTS